MNLKSFPFPFTFVFPLVSCLLLSPSLTLASSTTVYLGPIEKQLESGEIKINQSVGTVGLVKTIPGNCTDATSCVSINYIYSDHLGSTSLITNADGTKDTELKYYPYGTPVETQYLASPVQTQHLASLPTDRLYTGQRADFSTNLDYYNARQYNPKTGRFISADKAEGGNRYAYVGNNPVMRNDPSGNEADEEGGSISSDTNYNYFNYSNYSTYDPVQANTFPAVQVSLLNLNYIDYRRRGILSSSNKNPYPRYQDEPNTYQSEVNLNEEFVNRFQSEIRKAIETGKDDDIVEISNRVSRYILAHSGLTDQKDEAEMNKNETYTLEERYQYKSLICQDAALLFYFGMDALGRGNQVQNVIIGGGDKNIVTDRGDYPSRNFVGFPHEFNVVIDDKGYEHYVDVINGPRNPTTGQKDTPLITYKNDFYRNKLGIYSAPEFRYKPDYKLKK